MFKQSGRTLMAPGSPAMVRVRTEWLFYEVIRKVTGLEAAEAEERLRRDGAIDSELYVFIVVGR